MAPIKKQPMPKKPKPVGPGQKRYTIMPVDPKYLKPPKPVNRGPKDVSIMPVKPRKKKK